MEFSAHTKFAVFMIALLVICVPSVNAQCVRQRYYGSPINYIRKAHEQMHEILQYAKVDTIVYFIGFSKTIGTGSESNIVFEDVLYYVTSESDTSVRKLLAIRLGFRNGAYFLQDYAMLNTYFANTLVANPTDVASYSYILTQRFKFSAATIEAAYDAATAVNPVATTECRLIKEEFTFFYEMYPSRFQKIVN